MTLRPSAFAGLSGPSQPWWAKADVDGFFGLALDNLVQFLMLIGLCKGVLQFPTRLILGHIIPAAALALLAGNVFFAAQAQRLSGRSGRREVTAQPFGVSTIGMLGNVFLIMLPVRLSALGQGLAPEEAALHAWRVGLAAAGVYSLGVVVGALVVDWLRRAVPRPALLSTLTGMALCFLAVDFAGRVFAAPLVAMLPLGILLACYLSGVRAPLGVPAGAWSLVAGTLAAWGLCGMGQGPMVSRLDSSAMLAEVGLWLPVPVVGDVVAGLTAPELGLFVVPVVLPLVIANVLGSLQNVEAAAQEGDGFSARTSLAASGVCSIAGCLLGSCFPNTVYIGHAGFKAMGARVGYSLLNGLFFVVLATAGLFELVTRVVPVEAAVAIMVWVGMMVVVRSLRGERVEHGPAMVMGLVPAVAAWGVALVTQVLATVGVSPAVAAAAPPLAGLVALGQGFMLSGTIWACVVFFMIERRLAFASAWLAVGALLSFFGLIHVGLAAEHGFSTGIGWAAGWPWAMGYLLCAAACLVVRRVGGR